MNYEKKFNELLTEKWNVSFQDEGTSSWENKWFLDGDNARAFNADGKNAGQKKAGIELYSGPVECDNASHAVLWTKQVFHTDFMITYRFTRLDNVKNGNNVNILYLLASGEGSEKFGTDIEKWKAERAIASMDMYYNHMHLYHISYAVFATNQTPLTYIRARQYRCGALEDTNFTPDYDPSDFFQPGVEHKITAIISDGLLLFKVENSEKSKICGWKLNTKSLLKEGRIGLRQMWTRASRYADIQVYEK